MNNYLLYDTKIRKTVEIILKREELKIQNLTKLYILALFKSKDSVTGYSLLKKLEKDLHITASPTYVYKFLNDLQAEGFIESVPNPKSKRSKGFNLTEEGEKFVSKMFLRFDNLIEVAIQSRLKICASCGVNLIDKYYTEIIGKKEMNFCCKHCAKAYKDNLDDM